MTLGYKGLVSRSKLDVIAPPLTSFLKSHFAVLLHVAGPAYGGMFHGSSTNQTDYLLKNEDLFYSRHSPLLNCQNLI